MTLPPRSPRPEEAGHPSHLIRLVVARIWCGVGESRAWCIGAAKFYQIKRNDLSDGNWGSSGAPWRGDAPAGDEAKRLGMRLRALSDLPACRIWDCHVMATR